MSEAKLRNALSAGMMLMMSPYRLCIRVLITYQPKSLWSISVCVCVACTCARVKLVKQEDAYCHMASIIHVHTCTVQWFSVLTSASEHVCVSEYFRYSFATFILSSFLHLHLFLLWRQCKVWSHIWKLFYQDFVSSRSQRPVVDVLWP